MNICDEQLGPSSEFSSSSVSKYVLGKRVSDFCITQIKQHIIFCCDIFWLLCSIHICELIFEIILKIVLEQSLIDME